MLFADECVAVLQRHGSCRSELSSMKELCEVPAVHWKSKVCFGVSLGCIAIKICLSSVRAGVL